MVDGEEDGKGILRGVSDPRGPFGRERGQEWVGAYVVAWVLLDWENVGMGKSSIALYRAVPVSQSSHKGICSRESSSMLSTDGGRDGLGKEVFRSYNGSR